MFGFFLEFLRDAHSPHALALAMALLLLAAASALVIARRRRRRALAPADPPRAFSSIPELLVLAGLAAVLGAVAWELWHTHGVVSGSIRVSGKLGQRSMGALMHFSAAMRLSWLFAFALPTVAIGLYALRAARRGRSPWLAALGALAWSALIAGPVFLGSIYYLSPYLPRCTLYAETVSPWQVLMFKLHQLQAARWALMLCFGFSLLAVLLATLVAAQRLWRERESGNFKRWAPLASILFFSAALVLIAISPYRRENLDPLRTNGPLTGYVPRSLRPPEGESLQKIEPAPVLLAEKSGKISLDGYELETEKAWDAHRSLDRLSQHRTRGQLVFVADARLSTETVRELLSASYAADLRHVQLVFCTREERELRPVLGTISRRLCSALAVDLGLANEEPTTAPGSPRAQPVALPRGTWGDAARALRHLALAAPQQKVRLIID